MTGRVRDMIVDPEQTGHLREVIAEGAFYGMQTFDQALLKHHQAGKLLVASQGRTATTMDDVSEAAAAPSHPIPIDRSRVTDGAPSSSPPPPSGVAA